MELLASLDTSGLSCLPAIPCELTGYISETEGTEFQQRTTSDGMLLEICLAKRKSPNIEIH